MSTIDLIDPELREAIAAKPCAAPCTVEAPGGEIGSPRARLCWRYGSA
jgi:hypothetical protein